MIKVKKDLTDKVFGKLTVLAQAEDYISPEGKHQTRWLCDCECGNKKIIMGNSLSRGVTKSCGCLQKEIASHCNKRYNTYDLSGEHGIGYTSKREKFYFDLEDYDLIKDYCWVENGDGYLQAGSPENWRLRVKMHRLIMGCTDSNIFVDHINHNTMDNRKCNLRLVTPAQSDYNKSIQPYNTSGEIGVYYNKNRKQWIAQIVYKDKHYCKYCSTKDEAIQERKKLEDEYFGEYGYSNSMRNSTYIDRIEI